ncbi:hypothetical protein [Rhizobium hainanense]|uniref:hypothetical protein n=1 Tax=Rhizobium hainanense TaxID=52131 RepID=UPI00135630A2|nr:hypothetical protein [Rhizobium hainanense]
MRNDRGLICDHGFLRRLDLPHPVEASESLELRNKFADLSDGAARHSQLLPARSRWKIRLSLASIGCVIFSSGSGKEQAVHLWDEANRPEACRLQDFP